MSYPLLEPGTFIKQINLPNGILKVMSPVVRGSLLQVIFISKNRWEQKRITNYSEYNAIMSERFTIKLVRNHAFKIIYDDEK